MALVIPIFDLAQNVEAIIFHLAYLLTAPGNLFCNMQFHRPSLIFQKRFFFDNIIASTSCTRSNIAMTKWTNFISKIRKN